MNRRQVLTVIGGASIVVACAPGRDPASAWTNPGATETDPRRRALAWAILAPNPHNMQPWLADLRAPGELTLHVAPDRLLPQTDPFNRQIVVGSGAFLELMRMAAAHDGWRTTVDPVPEGEPQPRLDSRPLARVRFERAAPEVDPLFTAVLARRTNRSPFTARPVSPAHAERVAAAARRPGVLAVATVDPARIAALKAIAWRGAEVECHSPVPNREGTERTFLGARDIAAHPYGVSVRGPMVEVAGALGMLKKSDMQKEGSFAFNQQLEFLQKGAETARGFVWITTPDNSRAAQLAAGAAYLRANLQATALGLSMQPWSQCLQEYPSMAATLAAAHRALAPSGGRVQMFARLGYASAAAPPAPKRGVDAQIYRA